MRENKVKNKNIVKDKKKISSLSLMKCIIIITSIVQLVFSNININALLMLKNDMSGFVLFMFVLFGLVLIFEAMRLNGKKKSGYIKLFIFSTTDLIIGFVLQYMYFSELGIITQSGMKFVQQAIILNIVVCVAIVVTLVLNIYCMVKTNFDYYKKMENNE